MFDRQAYMKEYRQRPGVREKKRLHRRKNQKTDKYKHYQRKILYGLSPEKYNAMLLECGGHCMMCGKKKPLCVDHCHKTNKVRGLLCRSCNLYLGFYEVDGLMARCNKYLKLRGRNK